MREASQPTQDPHWVLRHEGYSVLTENAVESHFALSNEFLGSVPHARSAALGLAELAWLHQVGHHGREAVWPPVRPA